MTPFLTLGVFLSGNICISIYISIAELPPTFLRGHSKCQKLVCINLVNGTWKGLGPPSECLFYTLPKRIRIHGASACGRFTDGLLSDSRNDVDLEGRGGCTICEPKSLTDRVNSNISDAQTNTMLYWRAPGIVTLGNANWLLSNVIRLKAKRLGSFVSRYSSRESHTRSSHKEPVTPSVREGGFLWWIGFHGGIQISKKV